MGATDRRPDPWWSVDTHGIIIFLLFIWNASNLCPSVARPPSFQSSPLLCSLHVAQQGKRESDLMTLEVESNRAGGGQVLPGSLNKITQPCSIRLPVGLKLIYKTWMRERPPMSWFDCSVQSNTGSSGEAGAAGYLPYWASAPKLSHKSFTRHE